MIALALVFSISSLKGQSFIAFINPDSLVTPKGYTHAVIVPPGYKTIYISGQIPVNAKGEIVGKGDFKQQTIQVFENLKRALTSTGASFDDVVKMNTYVANFNAQSLSIIREIRSNYINKKNPPANTTVGITTSNPDILLEIEVVAVLK